MKLKLACVQFHSRPGEVAYNLDQMTRWCEHARAAGAEVALFPEACLTGYCRPREMTGLAMPFAGALADRLAELARVNKLLLAFGMPERDGAAIYNSLIAIAPDGRELARYRKTHLWAAETRWAKAGDCFVSFQTEQAHFGLMLCYDTRFPEVSRALALRGVTILLVASAWRSSHVEEWRFCARARALDNGVFLAGSDAILDADHFKCAGGSLIAGPAGEILAQARYHEESMIVAEIDTAALAARRRDLPLLEQRRPELYAAAGVCSTLPP
ncbi:MAG: carbon-nitrogen hydrolase family protein [candidate division KSB1 bacterium]|nr:carbon-nitrogen hydrolase family protein [candidate division KSB1 bacterium]MDZ7274045.1 carbon-nitrogen hydrolase family protein [candidate division KSB1 bacterium]MDZ7286418.1 carbon-nitrogen hydrolase family protein [candidate division KSB1 bacterium]MDZ7296646.1 carbon-nitrogen hydrolase family protein [candidate division KSB1 bacterium]MDZ7307263.1 carbon-nitrogen hydrolase family protein [candidate division KSB1 bacterium]